MRTLQHIAQYEACGGPANVFACVGLQCGSNNVKILFTTIGYAPAWRLGGPVLTASALAQALVARGHDVTVFTTDSNLDQTLEVPTDRMVDVNGVKVRYFRRRTFLPRYAPRVDYVSKSVGFLYAPDMRQALEQSVASMDLVHTQMPFIYPTYAAGRAALKRGKPLFYHQHGVLDPERLKFRSFKKKLYLQSIEMPLLKKARTLFALTEAEQANYRRLGLAAPVRIIPNGIDPAPHGAPADPAELRALGIEPQDRIVLFMARLHPIKGAERLLSAFLSVAHLVPTAKLVLAGPDEFGIESGFRARVASAGLSGRIRFPGMVSGTRKLSLLRRADLFCLPSDAEGFSMAVLEAMASRCAVLLSPGCHFPLAQEAGAGRIVRNDPDALARNLVELLSAPETMAAMGERGQRLVAEQFTWDRVADATIEAYQEGIRQHEADRSSL